MNCASLCRCFLLILLLVAPFGCNDAGNDEMTDEEQAEQDAHAGSEEYRAYQESGQQGPGGGGHGGGAGGHGGGSTPQ